MKSTTIIFLFTFLMQSCSHPSLKVIYSRVAENEVLDCKNSLASLMSKYFSKLKRVDAKKAENPIIVNDLSISPKFFSSLKKIHKYDIISSYLHHSKQAEKKLETCSVFDEYNMSKAVLSRINELPQNQQQEVIDSFLDYVRSRLTLKDSSSLLEVAMMNSLFRKLNQKGHFMNVEKMILENIRMHEKFMDNIKRNNTLHSKLVNEEYIFYLVSKKRLLELLNMI